MSSRVLKITAAIIAFAVVFSAGLYRAVFSAEESCGFIAMDTYNTLKIKGPGCKKTAVEIKEFTESFESVISRFSQKGFVVTLNKNGGGEIPEFMQPYFETLFDVNKKSGGAFDFALGAVSDLWGFGTENQRVPADDELAAALALSGCDKLTYEGGRLSIADGAVLDLGAAGKGIVLDEIGTLLSGTKVKRAVVSLGGSVLLYGGGSFSVGIQNPGGSGYIATLSLPACCVSTSGNYERYFEIDGERYHHILDPETGRPVQNGLASVTVISGSGTLTDALATACFVLGEEKGSRLCREYGCDAVFVYEDGGVSVTGDTVIEITDDNYTLRRNSYE